MEEPTCEWGASAPNFIVSYPLGLKQTTILHPNDGLRSLSIDEADTTQEEVRFQPSYTDYAEPHNVLQSLGERE